MEILEFKDKKLSLKNDGYLSLFFIGVGSAFTKKHYQTNLLIIKGDKHLLIDCRTKCPQGLYNIGLSVTDIENYLITHSHADHIGGLEEVGLINRYF
ncbi:MAG: MBL fold metallo-hydrolase, partial [Brevinematia bacterium]